MKISLLVLVFFTTSTLCLGQQFSINYLISLGSKNLDEFENIFLSKGWELSEENEPNSDDIFKTFTKSNNNWYAISLTEYEVGKRNVFYGFTDTQLYLTLKQQTKNNLFSYQGMAKTKFGKLYAKYKKGNIEIRFYSSQFKDETTSKNDYTISIFFDD